MDNAFTTLVLFQNKSFWNLKFGVAYGLHNWPFFLLRYKPLCSYSICITIIVRFFFTNCSMHICMVWFSSIVLAFAWQVFKPLLWRKRQEWRQSQGTPREGCLLHISSTIIHFFNPSPHPFSSIFIHFVHYHPFSFIALNNRPFSSILWGSYLSEN